MLKIDKIIIFYQSEESMFDGWMEERKEFGWTFNNFSIHKSSGALISLLFSFSFQSGKKHIQLDRYEKKEKEKKSVNKCNFSFSTPRFEWIVWVYILKAMGGTKCVGIELSVICFDRECPFMKKWSSRCDEEIIIDTLFQQSF